MSAQRRESVRIGPISLFTLVITLCLAVMAVLSVATARAQGALAERQASFTQDDYRNERAGQELLARIDEALAAARARQQNGATPSVGSISADLPQICQEVEETVGDGVAVTAEADGNALTAHIEAPSKRCLDVGLLLSADGTTHVTSWKATTLWTEPEETLWTGGSK